MPLKNCKVELRLISTNHGALSPNGNDNDDANYNNIILLSKTQVTLSAKYNQKLSKLFRKGFERSVYWNEYKTNIKNKNTANEYRYFLNLKLLGVNRFLVLVYSNQDGNGEMNKARSYELSKGVTKNYNVIINGKNFYDQRI